jgi:hypothetical protein
MTDLEIIYRVVVRNLHPDQSADISALQKRRLSNSLELLKPSPR